MHGIVLPGEWEFGQPRVAACDGRPVPTIDQHVTLTAVQPEPNSGRSTFVYVIGDRLDGRKQVYCVVVPVRFVE